MSGRRALWRKQWPDHPELLERVKLTVPFQDADPTGVAWHGNYFRYYDAARVALLSKLDFGYRQMAGRGQIWPIVDTRVRYLSSVPFGKEIEVSAQLVEWEFRMRIYYNVRDEAGNLLNEAYTIQVPVSARDESLIVGAPGDLVEKIEALIEP